MGEGGYWERLIQSVKCCFKKTIRQSTLNFDKLATILVEIESTLNNRPHVFVRGPSYTVTPSADLIYGHRIVSVITNQQYEIVSTAKSLMKRAKYQCCCLNNFIKQWRRTTLILSLRMQGEKE